MKINNLIIISIILISFIVGIYLYPTMPEIMASHWNSQGEVNGYMQKFWGLFIMPIMSVGLFLMFSLIPKIDPMKENIKKFREYFDTFIVILILFLFYIHLLTIFWNMGFKFNMTRFLVPSMGILLFYCGILIEKAKRNWFIGIKTPWTLSNDEVWDKTHKRGGKLFKICGVISFLSILFPNWAIFFTIIPIIFTSLYLFIYSYLEYKKIT
ncbi:MAG: SdpI family protein [Patescibacteria group bacterium]|nr:SdpI family protein [Patescibacteria group bacterium]MBU1877027.1 SdpI family protein [Patescibacteria group bacterium]